METDKKPVEFFDTVFKVVESVAFVLWMIHEFVFDIHKTILFFAICMALAGPFYLMGHKMLHGKASKILNWTIYVACIYILALNQQKPEPKLTVSIMGGLKNIHGRNENAVTQWWFVHPELWHGHYVQGTRQASPIFAWFQIRIVNEQAAPTQIHSFWIEVRDSDNWSKVAMMDMREGEVFLLQFTNISSSKQPFYLPDWGRAQPVTYSTGFLQGRLARKEIFHNEPVEGIVLLDSPERGGWMSNHTNRAARFCFKETESGPTLTAEITEVGKVVIDHTIANLQDGSWQLYFGLHTNFGTIPMKYYSDGRDVFPMPD